MTACVKITSPGRALPRCGTHGCMLGDAPCVDARIARLESALREYHRWHVDYSDDVDGYLDSALFEQACAAYPALHET